MNSHTIDGSCYANYAIKSPSISSQMHVNYVLYVLLHWLLRSFDGDFATSKVECNILETCVRHKLELSKEENDEFVFAFSQSVQVALSV